MQNRQNNSLKLITLFLALLLLLSVVYSQNIAEEDSGDDQDSDRGRRDEARRQRLQKHIDLGELETGIAGCVDGDSNSNLDTATASYAYDSQLNLINDFCAYGNEKQVLHEAYCNDEGVVDVKEVECPEGCNNGACRAEEKGKESCFDTDLKGESGLPNNAEGLVSVFGSKGATIGYYTSTESKYSLWEDYCTPDGKLVEYYCKKNKAGFTKVNCKCIEGKCDAPPYCVDSDGGDNKNVAGKVKGVNTDKKYFTFEDACNENALTEHSCGPEGSKITTAVCEFGCSKGKCLKEGEVPAAPTEEVVTPLPQAEKKVIKTVPQTELPPGTCKTDYNCENGFICSESKCAKVQIRDKESFIKELKRIFTILLEYEKILNQAEEFHTDPKKKS